MNDWSVSELIIDNYVGNRNERISKCKPTINEVREAIIALDGGNRSSLALTGSSPSSDLEEETVLCAGGGPDKYHVSITFVDKTLVLLGETDSEDEEVLIIGGVETPLPAQFVVDQQAAISAVVHFLNCGTVTSNQMWEEV